MKDLFKNRKMLITMFIICALVLIIGGTTAWYVWSSGEENKTVINATMGSATVVFNGGTDLTGQNLKPVVNKEDGIVKTITVQTKNDTLNNISFNLYLDLLSLPDELKDETFKYELYEGATLVTSGNFEEATTVECKVNSTEDTSVNHIVLVDNKTISTTLSTYTLYIWIDGTVDNDPAMAGKDFHFVLHADGQNAAFVEEPLVQHISNLYTNADKTVVPNNGIDYNYATSVSLMNDRLGTMTVGADQGNIRYYGSNPDNYIDIGDHYEQDTVVNHYEENAWILNNLGITSQDMCLSYANCPTLIAMNYFTDEDSCKVGLTTMFGTTDAQGICGTETISAGTPKSLYRIIGLFKDVELSDGSRKDLIKVMRNDTIGIYSWDQSESTVNYGNGVNEWSQADLMKLLNPGYEKETVGGSLYWNSGSGTCYGYDLTSETYTAIPCDLTNKGLSTTAQMNIETVKWNLGGWYNSSVFANQMYSYERQGNVIQNPSDGIKRTTVWSGRVALAYPSDYGYAVDLSSCKSTLSDYSNCISTNWMYPRMTLASNIASWLLTPYSSAAMRAWDVNSVGYVSDNDRVDRDAGVSPVFYLDSELTVESGTGKSDDPYVIW